MIKVLVKLLIMISLTTSVMAVTALVTSSHAYANNVFSVKAGINYFMTKSPSEVGEADDTKLNLEHSLEKIGEFTLNVDHVIPLVPNMRYAHHNADYTSTTTLEQTFILNQQTFAVASDLNTHHQLVVHDFLFDYPMFDISIFKLDVGVLARHQALEFTVDKINDEVTATRKVNKWEPMLHVNAQTGVPLLGFFVFAEFNEGRNNRLYQGGVGYSFDNQYIPDFDVKFGYRKEKVTFERKDGLIFAQDFNKTFAGVEIHF
jgi:outer membrane protein